ncbi:hypothetical protein SDC9_184353 [bioreactor metagenome]|uniref:Uncharacterized protein n=1 Tax=bioreactor metagenome TaxID=1076179 RepID=A0A645HCT5_9ZZZZ
MLSFCGGTSSSTTGACAAGAGCCAAGLLCWGAGVGCAVAAGATVAAGASLWAAAVELLCGAGALAGLFCAVLSVALCGAAANAVPVFACCITEATDEDAAASPSPA